MAESPLPYDITREALKLSPTKTVVIRFSYFEKKVSNLIYCNEKNIFCNQIHFKDLLRIRRFPWILLRAIKKFNNISNKVLRIISTIFKNFAKFKDF